MPDRFGLARSSRPMNPILVAVCSLMISMIVMSSPMIAQDLKADVVEVHQLDADYSVQGEYIGTILLDGFCRRIGLQVVAMGDGKFDAMLYRGGLPGNGYDGCSRHKLSGSRSGEQVVVGGENLVVVLQAGYAAIVKNAAGQRLGVLQPTKRLSVTLGATPPSNAIVLFDGLNTDRLNNAKVTADGLLEIGCETKEAYQNFRLHAEFRVPYVPTRRGQDRGNSGFYLQKRYEVQVLDSFGLDPLSNGCGSLYEFKAPNINMSFPPLRWQTYDIWFSAPKFSEDGRKLCKARITVLHNGITVHDRLELKNKTGWGRFEGSNPLPIALQDHGNPVHFRNLWLVEN